VTAADLQARRVLGQLVRAVRDARGLRQGQIPGVAQSKVSRLESGDTGAREDALIAVADGLGLTLREMLAEGLALTGGATIAARPTPARPKLDLGPDATARQREIVAAYEAAGGDAEEAGRRLGVSGQRVRQIVGRLKKSSPA